MDKMLFFGLFGHFHMEVNPEMIPNLFRRATESLKIEILNKKIIFIIFRKNKYFFNKIFYFKKNLKILN
jgi:hypothetical protein